MGIKSLSFLFSILLFSSLCQGNDKIVLEVVGHGECEDCAESNIKSGKAFSGLHVTIDCKAPNGELETRGEGKLDNEGKFIVSLPEETLENGKLKQDCYAQLHSFSKIPCPTQNSLESSKLVFQSKLNGKHIFTTIQKLKFSPSTCTSATFLPYFKHPPLSKFLLPPHIPFYKKPCPPLAPFFKKPLPPLVPIYKPKPKPMPPIVYKPPPYVKPLPPPVPVYKPKPKPKPPVYKPPVYKPPVYKPPVYKPPVYKPKPQPPVYKPPPYVKPIPPPVPIYKKPCPPIYKKPLPPLVPIYKPLPPIPTIPKKPPCPPLPKIPPKYFHHPIFAPWPPHSP